MRERSMPSHASRDENANPHALTTFEIALSDEELLIAAILEFDPDADPCPARNDLQTDQPPMLAISGAAFSLRTWEKLAGRHFAPSPTLDAPQPLQRFLAWRARYPNA